MKTNWKEWYSTGKLAAAGVGMQCLAAVIYAAMVLFHPLPEPINIALPIFWILGLMMITVGFPYRTDKWSRSIPSFFRYWLVFNPILQFALLTGMGGIFDYYDEGFDWTEFFFQVLCALPFVVVLSTAIGIGVLFLKYQKNKVSSLTADFWPVWILANIFIYIAVFLIYSII